MECHGGWGLVRVGVVRGLVVGCHGGWGSKRTCSGLPWRGLGGGSKRTCNGVPWRVGMGASWVVRGLVVGCHGGGWGSQRT